ncbi:hypothetical protein UA70_08885 [Raoultella planticola]|nr:hypothetical protein UA70_08885 [Raoultella planticola]
MDIGQRASHHPFHGADGVNRVEGRIVSGVVADAQARFMVVNHGRQQVASLMVGQSFGLTATHGSDQRIGGAQVNTRRQTTLVRRGTQTRLTNL